MEKTVTVKGIPVFYREKGEGDTVLILHGWRSSADSWMQVQDFLVKKGFHVVVPDLPGFARTPEPNNPWGVGDYTDFVDEFIRETNIQPRGIAGHSFGGRVAIFYAMKYGKGLPALILCDTAGIFRHKKIRIQLYEIGTKIGDSIMSLPPLVFLRPLMRKIWYRLSGEKDYYLTNGVMREIFKLVIEEPLRLHLPHITSPTLILWGEKDYVTPISDANILHEEIPTSYLHILKGVGHVINLEAPEQTARQMYLFLKR